MSSVLTNSSAVVAMQILKSINSGLAKTQSAFSTDQPISSAPDNAPDQVISGILSFAKYTVVVTRRWAETVINAVKGLKAKTVGVQAGNADLSKINAEVIALMDQIKSDFSAAQFNGLNFVDGASGNVDILSSIDRDVSVAVGHFPAVPLITLERAPCQALSFPNV